MTKPILCLEIADANINLLEYRHERGQLIIEKAARIATPKKAVVDGMMTDTQKLVKAIKAEIKANKYRAKNMIVVIKSSEIIIRDILMPVMAKRDLDTILSFQYQDYLLGDLSDYQTTHRLMEKILEDNVTKQKVRIVAAPNKIISPLIAIANELKKKVRVINIASEAVVNIFSKHNGITVIEEDEILVIDVDQVSAVVTVVSKGLGKLSKYISFGSDCLSELVAEIKRFLQFYSLHYEGHKVEKIYMIGEEAYSARVSEAITKGLKLPCQSGLQLALGQVQCCQRFQEESAYYAKVLGMVNEF